MSSHSQHQSHSPGLGAIKTYQNGVVGIQANRQDHSGYRASVKPLKDLNPKSNDLLFNTFNVNRK